MTCACPECFDARRDDDLVRCDFCGQGAEVTIDDNDPHFGVVSTPACLDCARFEIGVVYADPDPPIEVVDATNDLVYRETTINGITGSGWYRRTVDSSRAS